MSLGARAGDGSSLRGQLTRTPSDGGAPPLPPRVSQLIAELQLEPHPEGGRYRRVYTSARMVQPLDSRPPRPSLTTIDYLLTAGEHSRWHRVASDEAWHFYEGDPLELFWIDEDDAVRRETLSSGSRGDRPVTVVPAGCWQAARPTGSYALVGCTVGPGFDFADFAIATEASDDLSRLRQLTEGLPDLF